VFGTLRQRGIGPRLQLDLGESPGTVADVLARLGVDPAEVGIVVVDGRQSNLNELLPASCRVSIFPPMAGG